MEEYLLKLLSNAKFEENLTSQPLALIVPINDDIKYRDSTASLPSAHQGHPPEIRINVLTRKNLKVKLNRPCCITKNQSRIKYAQENLRRLKFVKDK